MKRASIEQRLEEDHRSIGNLIARLCEALAEFDGEQSFALLDLVWARLAVHIRAEHLCLFPALLDAARERSSAETGGARFDEAQKVITQLRHDHDFFMTELARAISIMRAISSLAAGARRGSLRVVLQIINVVKARLEEHNRLEEEEVYRWPAVVFDSSRQAQLSECARHELENMPPRFS
jgi:hypothetical protein